MSRPKKQNRFIQILSNGGSYIYLFFQLQLYWLLFSLRGFIVLGVFPALSSVVHILYKLFKEEEIPSSIWEEFKQSYQENFKQSNQLGYLGFLVMAILYVDFRVNETFLQSLILQFLLLVLTLVFVLVYQYTLTVLVRYEFGFKNILKQSFYVSLAAPIASIASIVGLFVVIWILESIPLLFLFFGIPLILLPIVWFTYYGIQDAEQKKMEAKK